MTAKSSLWKSGWIQLLTKDLVMNIEKRALKDLTNKKNVPAWTYPFP